MFCSENAKVYTGERNFAEAVYVSEGRIAAVGRNEDVKRTAAGKGDVRVIDCAGRTIVPGFSDSHMHLFGLALNLTQAQISDFVIGRGYGRKVPGLCRE